MLLHSCTLEGSRPCKPNIQSASSAPPEWSGQRFIQLLENHPWFEITWLAASDRSSGKTYGEAAKWRLDTPLPERIARMTVSPAEPGGTPPGSVPKIIFAGAGCGHRPRAGAANLPTAGCAVMSNSSAFRMAPNVPLVIPEVNAEHLHLIEEQPSRKAVGRLHGHQSQLLDHWPGDGAEAD